MARIEKTVFISYRRKDVSWALAVYQYLTSQKYDVFFDFTSIPSGDFEQIIVSNIRARAHFILILTPSALDRCSEPGDWLRREIETAIDEKRNIIPVFFDGFNFGLPSVAEKMTGKISDIQRYNGLDIPQGYFMEAMTRLSNRYLNVPLNAVIHPVSTEVRKIVKDEQVAVDKALIQKSGDIKELVKPAEEKPVQSSLKNKDKPKSLHPSTGELAERKMTKPLNMRLFGIGVGLLLMAVLGIFGFQSFRSFVGNSFATPTATRSTPTLTITPSPVPALGIGSTMTGQDGMTLLYVPAGDFTMGSDSDEKPVHTVYLDAFWIDQMEVTNAMYAKCVGAGVCNEPSSKSSKTRNNYYGKLEFDNYPVINVSWNDANAYCSWAGRRLPTEAEWEKAARWKPSPSEGGQGGGEAFTYPWGNTQPSNSLLNYDQAVGDTTEVGKYPNGASPYGALDMAGNIWEWVNDWYGSKYYQSSPSSNPQGPSSGDFRVMRGGAWFNLSSLVRSAYRAWDDPTYSSYTIGFRCSSSQ